MKTLHFLLLGLICYANTTYAEVETLPSEILKLQERRIEEMAKIDSIYVESLEKYMDHYTRSGDLESAVQVKALIDEIKEKQKIIEVRSARNVLIKSEWKIQGGGGYGSKAIFQNNGVAVNLDTNEKLWKWKLDGKTLWCHWYTSGWVKFEVPDNPATDKWTGVSRGGHRFYMRIND